MVLDVAIASENAIPVPRDTQTVAEAMSLVKAYFPVESIFKFHCRLAAQAQAQARAQGDR